MTVMRPCCTLPHLLIAASALLLAHTLPAVAQDAGARPPLAPGSGARIQSIPENRTNMMIMRTEERDRMLQGLPPGGVGQGLILAAPPPLPGDSIRIVNKGGSTVRFSTWSPQKKWLSHEVPSLQYTDISCTDCGEVIYVAFQDSAEQRQHKLAKAGSYSFIWATDVKRWRLAGPDNKYVDLWQ